ncbi:hypothetical protein BSKO_05602 [Bryopsis sp. KO-2023]|nr:hypothetical protein BSKO_05602 [Bryopsis sp. KO-2023]
MEGAAAEDLVIKDLDSGRKFVLSGANTEEASVNDSLSGQQLSMKEFDRQLGIRTGRRSADASSASTSDTGSPHAPGQDLDGLSPRLKRLNGFKLAKALKDGLSRRRGDGSDSPSATAESPYAVTQPSFTRYMPHSPYSTYTVQNTPQLQSSATMKVASYRRTQRDLSDLRLVQEINVHNGVVSVMRFSPNGEYLVTGGKDTIVYLWAVVSNRGKDMKEGCRIDLPVVEPEPVRRWKGHTSHVLDIAWSFGSELVLSASMDKTVRLWTLSQDACLREIPHQTWVTSIRFHPQDPGKFVSGCGDGVLRLWDVMARKVVGSASIANEKDLYTALCFNGDGRMLLAGSLRGKCRLYQIFNSKIEIKAEIDVRNRRGRHARGRKVTGIDFTSVGGQPRFLVTTSDSRIRMLQASTSAPSEVSKFKGHTNESDRLIVATSSSKGDYVICGSDDGRVFVWPASATEASSSPRTYGHVGTREKVSAFESYKAHDGYTTSAIFAPENCQRPMTCLASVDCEPNAATTPVGRLRIQHKILMPQISDGCEKGLGLWGQVIVTAGQGGEIRVWENFGLPDQGYA